MRLTRRLLLICLIALLTAADQPTQDARPRHGLALLGASATAGWGVIVPVLNPTEGNRFHHVQLADALHALDPTLPPAVTASGSPGFFRTSLKNRAGIVSEAIAARPEAFCAVDFLFWYGYGTTGGFGEGTTAQRRAQRLELGLAQLDRLVAEGVPVIVGDLPDFTDALEAKPFSFLARGQVPTIEVQQALNARIHAWAQGKANVHLMPLAKLVADMKAGKPVPGAGTTWGPTPRMVQHDRLHPSSEGLLALGAVTTDALRVALGRDPIQVDKSATRVALQRKDRPIPTAQ